jgi:hypothetical protein
MENFMIMILQKINDVISPYLYNGENNFKRSLSVVLVDMKMIGKMMTRTENTIVHSRLNSIVTTFFNLNKIVQFRNKAPPQEELVISVN